IPPPSIYPRGYAFLDDNPDRARCHMRWWEDIRPKEGGSRGVRPWATTGRTLSLWHRRVGRRTMSVLVTYATAFGSTREIAERVGEVIGKWVPSAVVRPVDEMDTVAGYDAIVVGSAVHNQVWLPEAREFVRRNAADLSDRPVWTFSVGMPGALPRLLRRMAMSEEAILRAQFKGVVGPVGHHLFSGVV